MGSAEIFCTFGTSSDNVRSRIKFVSTDVQIRQTSEGTYCNHSRTFESGKCNVPLIVPLSSFRAYELQCSFSLFLAANDLTLLI